MDHVSDAASVHEGASESMSTELEYSCSMLRGNGEHTRVTSLRVQCSENRKSRSALSSGERRMTASGAQTRSKQPCATNHWIESSAFSGSPQCSSSDFVSLRSCRLDHVPQTSCTPAAGKAVGHIVCAAPAKTPSKQRPAKDTNLCSLLDAVELQGRRGSSLKFCKPTGVHEGESPSSWSSKCSREGLADLAEPANTPRAAPWAPRPLGR
mmetsp:Transcript_64496/g.209342  ORF Transcript_64496/g.209342 Transcript_64496/m.209342 type:complete len:210 (+) Transcript_64496:100-729(+)